MDISGRRWKITGFFLFLIILVIALYLSAPISSSGLHGNNSSGSQSGEKFIFYTEELPPLNYINQQGEISGRSTEVVREIARRTGYDPEIHLGPWSKGYNIVLSKQGTALFSTVRSHQRDNMFKWVGPIATLEYSFYGMEGNTQDIHNLDDVRRAGLIAVVENDARHQVLLSSGITNLLVLPDDRSCIAALSEGKAALWFGTKETYSQGAIQIGDDMSRIRQVWSYQTVGLYIAFNINTPKSMISKWQLALDSMKTDGTYEMILERYMPYICSWVQCTN
ncbi:MAG: transporter substrate-binding domain-containing protein [Methanobacteriota archaeon]